MTIQRKNSYTDANLAIVKKGVIDIPAVTLVDPDGNSVAVGGGASNGLTDAQLRAAPVPVAKSSQTVASAAFAGNNTTSGVVNLGSARAVGLSIPAGIAATSLTFQSSYNGVDFVPVYDSTGTPISVTIGASRRVVLDPAKFYGIQYLKLVANAATAAAIEITVIAEA